jgi:hypothetical protein
VSDPPAAAQKARRSSRWGILSQRMASRPLLASVSSSRIALLAAALACALVASAPSTAAAQTGERLSAAEADRRALTLYEEGSAAFAREDYSTAAARFEAAFTLSPRPRILYNLGVTYDRMGIPQQAVDAYERFLHQLPNAPERAQVEERLRVLRADAEAAHEQATREHNSGNSQGTRTIVSERVVERPVIVPRAHTARTVGFVLGAFALASGGAAGGVAGFSAVYYQGLRESCGDLRPDRRPDTQWCEPFLVREVQLRATLVNVFMFSAIGLAIASGISFGIDLGQGPDAPAARPAPRSTQTTTTRARPAFTGTIVASPNEASVVLGGRF